MGCTIRTAKLKKADPPPVVVWANDHLASTPKALAGWDHTRTQIYLALRQCLGAEVSRQKPRGIRLACLKERIQLLSSVPLEDLAPLLLVKESTLGQPDLVPGNAGLSGEVIGAIRKLSIPEEHLNSLTKGGAKP